MGLRGPLPGGGISGRVRQRGVVASRATRRALAEEIAMLERDGKKLYRDAVKKPTTNTPNAGEQMSGTLKAALAILDRATKLRLQLDRLGGPLEEEGSNRGKGKTDEPSGLAGFRAARPR